MPATRESLLRDYHGRVAAIARTRYHRLLRLAATGAASEECLESAELDLLRADLDLALCDCAATEAPTPEPRK